MRKGTHKMLAVSLAVMLMMTALAACSTAAPAATSAAPVSTAAPTAAPATPEPVKEKEMVTLSAFVMQSASSTFGLEEDWFAEILKEKLKLQIEFMPTGDQVDQKMQALLAGGELPDIVGFKDSKLAMQATQANLLLDIDQYQDLYPNLYQNPIFKYAVKYSRDELSNGTGKMFLIPTAVGPLGATNDCNWKSMLMWDVYEDIGRPEINTLEDYLTVVKKMQDAYPKNDKGEKVYGFSLFPDWDVLTAQQISTLSFFYGIDSEYVSRLMETNLIDNSITSALADTSFYRRALKFYFKANQMGLLDPDSLTQKFDTVQEKFTAGRVLFTYYSWLNGKYNNPDEGHVNAEDPNGYEFVPAKDFKIYDAPYQWVGRTWYLSIGAASKYPDRAVELMNYLYDMETYELLGNGPKDLYWIVNDKGEPQIKDEDSYNALVSGIQSSVEMPLPGGGKLADPMVNWNTLGYVANIIDPKTGFTAGWRYWPSTLARKPTNMKAEWREWTGCMTQIEYLNKNNMIAPAPQAINMVKAAPDDLQLKIDQIGDVVKTYSWQMVFAKDEATFDSLWSEMAKKADGLGMPEVITYYTQAWADAQAKAGKYQD